METSQLNINNILSSQYRLKAACRNAYVVAIQFLIEKLKVKTIHENELSLLWRYNDKQVQEIMELLVKHKVHIIVHNGEIFKEACKKGLLNVVMYLQTINYFNNNLSEKNACQGIENASVNGHLEILKYIVRNKPVRLRNAYKYVFKSNHIDIVEYFLGTVCYNSDHTEAFRGACKSNNVEMVKYLLKKVYYSTKAENIYMYTNKGIAQAAERGYIEILKSIFEFGKEIGEECYFDMYSVFRCACKNKYTEILNLLVEQKMNKIKECDSFCLLNASKYGHVNIVMKIAKECCISNSNLKDSFIEACSYGHLEIVMYFIKYECVRINTFDKVTFLKTCKYNHLNVIKYFAEKHNFDVHINNNEGFIEACKYGHLDIVKYFVEKHHVSINFCNNIGTRVAIDNEQLHIVKYFNVSDSDKKNTYKLQKLIDTTWNFNTEFTDFISNYQDIILDRPLIKKDFESILLISKCDCALELNEKTYIKKIDFLLEKCKHLYSNEEYKILLENIFCAFLRNSQKDMLGQWCFILEDIWIPINEYFIHHYHVDVNCQNGKPIINFIENFYDNVDCNLKYDLLHILQVLKKHGADRRICSNELNEFFKKIEYEQTVVKLQDRILNIFGEKEEYKCSLCIH